ncbi:phosphoglucomutase/phosphomannomutase family protein [Candidatus Saganbacteria bacterium]|nr:phosphoglucomutase/phosphomannomutase family protein [Candidatus Saganbacteria bacterium]
MASIKFGTDGWRAEIARDFTFENLSKVTYAFIRYLVNSGLADKGIAVGYDNRFQSEDFARKSAEICSNAGIKTFLSEISLPSPALSYYVYSQKLSAGIMITASHNPSAWNGFKIKESFGGSARPEVTQAIEAELQSLNLQLPTSNIKREIETFDPKPDYLKHIASFVDLNKIKSAGITMVLDPMNGSGSSFLKELLPDLVEINNNRDPLFHGVAPEPLPVNLSELSSIVKDGENKNKLTVGIAIDGDADRIAAYDPDGTYISSHYVFSLILKHLVENKKLKGKIVKTFNISRLVEFQAKEYGLEIIETPIGFKYIADQFLRGGVLIGGEESGGLGIIGNIPERDGSLNALLLLELVAITKKTLSQNLNEIMKKHGFFYYDRIDLHLSREIFGPIMKELVELKEFGGLSVSKVETLDGVKLNFADESWILFRASGTEPLLRIYAEGKTMDNVKLLLSYGQKLFTRS